MWRFLFGPRLGAKAGLVSTFAASLAYYFIMALVPLLVVSLTLVSLVLPMDASSQFMELVRALLPPDSLSAAKIIETVRASSKGGFLTAGFLLALWSAFNFMNALLRALHFIFEEPDAWEIPLLQRVTQSGSLLLIWALTLSLSALSFVLFLLLQQQSRDGGSMLSPIFSTHGVFLRDGLVLMTLFGATALTYRITPLRPPPLRLVLQGAFLAALGWVTTCYVFAYVLPLFWRHNALYGALGSFVATMLWAYCCAWSLLLGACWMMRFDWELIRRGGVRPKRAPARRRKPRAPVADAE